ncbi:hypothetical protein BDP27DRAFT_1297792 [Rhodocollybia butyracea]|uniref:Ndc10 domain-containing protein n=1 Tax=Rhodocollybia butyracea TaxID=206335 RepID=A0A9P5PIE1_9AGAR|nr:hypothetical protein BDP27DRAFT_1297792 [Rhodocollybia butyracea]
MESSDQIRSSLTTSRTQSQQAISISLSTDSQGNPIASRAALEQALATISTKRPLHHALQEMNVKFTQRAKVNELKILLLNARFPNANTNDLSMPAHSLDASALAASNCPPLTHASAPKQAGSGSTVRNITSALDPPCLTLFPPNRGPSMSSSVPANSQLPASVSSLIPVVPQLPASVSSSGLEPVTLYTGDGDEADLVNAFNIEGAHGEEIFGYDLTPVMEDSDSNSEDEDDLDCNENFKKQVHVEASARFEKNRRAGGRKTQDAMIRRWKEFISIAKFNQWKILDDIVDEHSLLLYIKYTAERPKQTRQGVDIKGTFVGAAQLKKQYFGALRIRKQQEAADPSLKTKRPATSVIVWDAIKNRMDEALNREWSGDINNPDDDAEDIIAQTFLDAMTQDKMDKINLAFLQHSHMRQAVFGHLAHTAQHASGNRGDDFRAYRLAELQPYTMIHPNKVTAMHCTIGMQSEEKAGRRGMKTRVNPSYSVFVAHADPLWCPQGAWAMYHHLIHDVEHISDKCDISWDLNKTWRKIHVLHGPDSPETPLSGSSLYNLYRRALDLAGVKSKMKQHLPRHLLGYKNEKMGVDPNATAKMGWSRGSTFFDTYAPALPKAAILGAHGFKEHEGYDPIWRHVHVPDQFLTLMCPMAEEVLDSIVGRQNLTGAANYWTMIINLRPYLFQCAAAIFQVCPKSSVFRLPALANSDVQNWMRSTFPTDLSLLKANAGNPLDLERLQNDILQRELSAMNATLQSQSAQISRLLQIVERRTEIFSPAKGYSIAKYHQSATTAGSTHSMSDLLPAVEIGSVSCAVNHNSSVYEAKDETLRAFANSVSPKTPQVRDITQVDYVLPDTAAFYAPGAPHGIWPPLFGQKSIRWDDVFNAVHPRSANRCWSCWKPGKTLGSYKISEIWGIWTQGEVVVDNDGVQTGLKPPLGLVEQHFREKWRSGKVDNAKIDGKQWERFREIPEWIDGQASSRGVSPQSLIQELENMCKTDSGTALSLNQLRLILKTQRETTSAVTPTAIDTPDPQSDVPVASFSPLADTSTTATTSTHHTSDSAKRRKPAADPRRPKKLKTA